MEFGGCHEVIPPKSNGEDGQSMSCAHCALEVDTRCRSILRSAESKLTETSWELAKQVAEGDTRERESLSTSHSTSSIDSLSD